MRDSPLVQLTLTRLREFFREPGAVFWVFGFPVLLAVGLGIAFRNRPPDKPRVAVEPGADWLAQPLSKSELLAVELLDRASGAEALRRARVDLHVRAEDGAVLYRYDPVRPESRLARAVVDDVLQSALGRSKVIAARDEQVSEPGSRYVDFLLPGLLGMNVMGSSMWGIGYTIVQQRRNKLLKRLAATPMRRSHFMLSQLLARLVFLVFEVTAIVVFGALVFDVAVRGSYAALATVSVAGAAAFASIALIVGARVRSMEVAAGWMNAVMLPMWLASGSFFSYERFPEVFLPVIRALPLTALNDAFRAVFNDAASLASVGSELAVLAGWTGLGLLIAVRTFRWQ